MKAPPPNRDLFGEKNLNPRHYLEYASAIFINKSQYLILNFNDVPMHGEG